MGFTNEQRAAIDDRSPYLLISAAAGSGKTAVLVEHIISMIVNDNISIERMLIVTFTRAAASEIKLRLSKRLYEESKNNYELVNELSKLAYANIGTMDSFYYRLIRQEFAFLKIDINIKIINETYEEKLYQEALDCMFEEVLNNPSADMLRLTASYTEEEILDIVDVIYNKMLSMPDPFNWLNDCMDSAKFESNIRMLALDQIKHTILSIKSYLASPIDYQMMDDCAILREFDLDRYPFDENNLSKYRVKLGRKKTWSIKLEEQYGVTKEEDEFWTSKRNNVKDQLKKIDDYIKLLNDFSDTKDTIISNIKALAEIIKSLHKHFVEIKLKKNVLSFSDMNHLALKLIKEPDIQNKISQSFDVIFVDECQDNSSIQDHFVNCLKSFTNKIFMVGDIKQSIYRFRQAEPKLFLDKLRTYNLDENSDKRKILLNKNFRSNPLVIDAVNRVFNTVFNPNATELQYERSHDWLIAGRDDTEGAKVKLRYIYCNSSKIEDSRIATSQYIANQIKKLIGTPLPNSNTIITYSDIAILMPTVQEEGLGGILLDQLSIADIPFVCQKINKFSDFTGLSQVVEWLTILTNAYNDVALLAILRGPTFDLDDETLAQIRLYCPIKDAMFTEAFYYCANSYINDNTFAKDTIESDVDFENYVANPDVDWLQDMPKHTIYTFREARSYKKNISNNNFEALPKLCYFILKLINQERFLLRSVRLDKYIWSFFERSELYSLYSAQESSSEYIQQIEAFCVKANRYVVDTGLGVSDFIEDYKNMKKNNRVVDEDTNIIGSNTDYITITTMHASKGLEYPIVFLMGIDQDLKHRGTSNVYCHKKYGIGLNFIDPDGLNKSDSIALSVIKEVNEQEELSEKARLLYVAMTRARDVLYMVMTDTFSNKENTVIDSEISKKIEDDLNSLDMGELSLSLMNCKKYIDFIQLAIAKDDDLNYSMQNIYNLYKDNDFIDESLVTDDINMIKKYRDFYEWDIKIGYILKENLSNNTIVNKFISQAEMDSLNAKLAKINIDSQVSSKSVILPDYSKVENLGERVLLKTSVTYISDYIVSHDEFNLTLPISDNDIPIPKPHTLVYHLNIPNEVHIKPDLTHEAKPPSARRIGTLSHYLLELLDIDKIRTVLGAYGKSYDMNISYADIAKLDEISDKQHTSILDDDTIAKFRQELSLCNIESTELQTIYDMVKSVMDSLLQYQNITQLEYDKINPYNIVSFFISDIGIRMLNSNLVLKEHSITLFLPEWDPSIAQGNIDICFLEDGKWVIIDYKSDGQDQSSDSKNYIQQLALYKLALDQASPFKTKECFIYSIKQRKEFRI